jgi:hypothetical protein
MSSRRGRQTDEAGDAPKAAALAGVRHEPGRTILATARRAKFYLVYRAPSAAGFDVVDLHINELGSALEQTT